MKLSLNKNEAKLVRLMIESMDVDKLQHMSALMGSETFQQTFKTLSHKIQQQLGKFELGVGL